VIRLGVSGRGSRSGVRMDGVAVEGDEGGEGGGSWAGKGGPGRGGVIGGIQRWVNGGDGGKGVLGEGGIVGGEKSRRVGV